MAKAGGRGRPAGAPVACEDGNGSHPNGRSRSLTGGRPCTMPGMTYVSSFGDMDTEHQWPDALCLSRTHCVNASEETIGEFYEGAIALIDAGIDP